MINQPQCLIKSTKNTLEKARKNVFENQNTRILKSGKGNACGSDESPIETPLQGIYSLLGDVLFNLSVRLKDKVI